MIPLRGIIFEDLSAAAGVVVTPVAPDHIQPEHDEEKAGKVGITSLEAPPVPKSRRSDTAEQSG